MTYNLSIEDENKEIAKRYKGLLKGAYQTFTAKDKKEIRRAFDLALEAHKNQRRKTGEPFIFHPIAVAKIVAYEIGLDTTSIVSALLHDVVEDTHYTVDDIQQLFGESVARIVNGLTKISHLSKEPNASIQAENYRKMLLTLSDDVRVILIKIADRLHNMQTMDAMPLLKQVKISSETLYIYAPMAHRLGLYNIKSELENLGLKYTEPDVYQDISNKITQSKEEQNIYIKQFADTISKSLDEENFKYEIKGRRKSIYSIRQKMLNQNVSYEEIFDKFAIRIIFESTPKLEKFDSWKIYSIVTDHFSPNPTRMRDWISNPKSTGYESLHITVMGPLGKWVEVQIRSARMNEIAEKGYAAHYKYKNKNERETGLDDWLNKIKDTLETSNTNAIDFVEDIKLNLYSKEIFVFTPEGDLIALPKNATALDFAFSIHTQVGMNCRGAKVNGKLKPISHVLISGDQVEIITSKNQKPSPGWLEFVVTARARTRIKNTLKEDQKRVAAEGKEILSRKLRHLKLKLNQKLINDLVNHFKLKTSLDLFFRVGNGTLENNHLKEFIAQRNNTFVNFFRNKIRRTSKTTTIDNDEVTANYDLLVFGKDEERLNYTISKCCNSIPGDDVFGFITINEGIKIHKKDCPNAISLQAKYAYRIISARWIDSSKQDFIAIIQVSGSDHIGMSNDLTAVVSKNMNVNIKSINISSDDGIFDGKITVVVKNQTQLQKLCNSINKIEGVEKVDRIFKH